MVTAFLRRGLVPLTTGSIAALAFLTLAGCSTEPGNSTLGVSTAAYRPAPPDAIGSGPSATANAEYRFAAVIDPDVIAGRFTEVWARVYRPDPLPAGTSPVLVFLHGNHNTCGICASGYDADSHCLDGTARIDNNSQYTTSGTCPGGYVVAPSHAGYGYMADQLASWGYIVVSINVNRGINAAGGIAGDGGLNLTRGRMVLRHLELLSRWNSGTDPTPVSLGVDLTGKLDFSSVGLLGHSRGGEGIRAAYQQYRDGGSIWPPRIGPVTFQGMFEIGPVDGQTSRILTPDSTTWEVLLPMCDGDVSNLQGIMPYDRVRYAFGDNPATRKGNSTVYGANHNYFNTEWQQSDSGGCTGPSNPPIFNPALIGSTQQQSVAGSLAMAMFRGAVGPGANAQFLNAFDPLYLPPVALDAVTRVDRGFTFSPSSTVSLVLENFTSGATFTSSGLLSFARGTLTEHAAARQVGLMTWNPSGPGVWLQSDFAGGPFDLSGYSIFEFDVDRQLNGLNPVAATNFHVQLEQAGGALSDPVSASSYAVIDGPQGGPFGNVHAMLKTARIPIGDFTSVDLTQIAGVRFTFDDTVSGAIFLSTIAADSAPPPGMGATQRQVSSPESIPMQPNVYTTGNMVSALRTADRADLGQVVMIDLTSNTDIPPKGELTVVNIGGQEFLLNEYRNGDTKQLSVILTQAEFDSLPDAAKIVVKYGRGDSQSDKWIFPALNKHSLKK